MPHVYAPLPPTPTPAPWPDHLARRIHPPAPRLRTLSAHADGRIALGVADNVSVLAPQKILSRLWHPLPPPRRPSHLVVDRAFRISQSIRPPVVGHELVFRAAPDPGRKDTTRGIADVVSLAWAPPFLAFVDGAGAVFLLRPDAPPDAPHNAAWGCLLRGWQCAPVSVEPLAPKPHHPRPEPDPPARPSRRPRRPYRDASDSDPAPDTRHVVAVPQRVRSDALCVAHAQLRDDADADADPPAMRSFLVLGCESGVAVYALASWDRMHAPQRALLTLQRASCRALAVASRVPTARGERAVVAAAGPAGAVDVHQVALHGAQLRGERVWSAAPSPVFRQVNMLSFARHTLRDACLTLLVAASNGFFLVDWGTRAAGVVHEWERGEVHCVEDAHDPDLPFVTAAVLCIDGSVITAGLDGDIRSWRLQTAPDATRRTASCVTLQSAGTRRENVMSVATTMNGFGVFALTTSRRAGDEVRDVEDATVAKFAATARRTMVSLYCMPPGADVNQVEAAIACCLERLEKEAYYGTPLCLWDIELFLERYDCEGSGLLARLSDRFSDMLAVQERKDTGAREHYQRARVMLWLSRLMLRAARDRSKLGRVESQRAELRNSLLCAQYDASLARFLAQGVSVDSTTPLERKALECMCQFVSICKPTYVLDVDRMKERVVQTRDFLHPCIARGETTTTACPVCAGEAGVPLVADADEPGSFYCFAGDAFPRCVATGLPCTAVVPRVCPSCDARAEPAAAGLPWVRDVDTCPLCLAGLLAGSAEPF